MTGSIGKQLAHDREEASLRGAEVFLFHHAKRAYILEITLYYRRDQSWTWSKQRPMVCSSHGEILKHDNNSLTKLLLCLLYDLLTYAGSDDLCASLYSPIILYSDIPTKQFILHLNSKQAQGFIINDLDDTHVFVEANAVQQIR
jgi:Transcription factor TFIIH complex subunit Tfb5